jgi:hypothetical protein
MTAQCCSFSSTHHHPPSNDFIRTLTFPCHASSATIHPLHTLPPALQLASMEAWLKAQEVALSLNEAASLPRPSSAPLDPYAPRPSLFSSSLSTPASPVLGQPYSVTTAVAGDTGFLGSQAMSQYTGSQGQGPFRSSFLAGTYGVLVLRQRDTISALTAACDAASQSEGAYALHAG